DTGMERRLRYSHSRDDRSRSSRMKTPRLKRSTIKRKPLSYLLIFCVRKKLVPTLVLHKVKLDHLVIRYRAVTHIIVVIAPLFDVKVSVRAVFDSYTSRWHREIFIPSSEIPEP